MDEKNRQRDIEEESRAYMEFYRTPLAGRLFARVVAHVYAGLTRLPEGIRDLNNRYIRGLKLSPIPPEKN